MSSDEVMFVEKGSGRNKAGVDRNECKRDLMCKPGLVSMLVWLNPEPGQCTSSCILIKSFLDYFCV